MKWQIPNDSFERKVMQLSDAVQQKADLPPLIVHFVEGDFELNDGNHRLEAYKRLGITQYYVIVWITEKEEYAAFMDQYADFLE